MPRLGDCGRQSGLKLQRLLTRFPAPLPTYQRAHRSAICKGLSKFRAFNFPSQDYAGRKQRSHKIIIIQMFAIPDKEKPKTKSMRGLNLAAVKCTIVQVTELQL
jgi:hypothetical protein